MRFLFFLMVVFYSASTMADTVDDGYKAYDAGDYEKAKSIILPLAEQEIPKAMNAMGVFLIEGKAFPQNLIISCDWYEKAAIAGYSAAQYNFSGCFDGSGGRKRSVKQQLAWLTKAAKESYLNAQIELMFWYMKRNKELAKKWGEKAATQNNVTARVSLWMANMDDNIPPVKFSEVACVFFNTMLLKRGWLVCDD